MNMGGLGATPSALSAWATAPGATGLAQLLVVIAAEHGPQAGPPGEVSRPQLRRRMNPTPASASATSASDPGSGAWKVAVTKSC
jgi:hypothetical protein